MIRVRRAQDKDIKRVTELLAQVLELHADLRPDLFIHGTTKYTENQLSDIFADEKTPVFVAVDDSDTVQGYAFCILKEPAFATNMTDIKTLYIDDLCVDSNERGRHIGTTLFDYVMDFARTSPSYETSYTVDDVTGKNGWGNGYTFPCLFKNEDKGWILISETSIRLMTVYILLIRWLKYHFIKPCI